MTTQPPVQDAELIARLNTPREIFYGGGSAPLTKPHPLLAEAADRIAALRAELAAVRVDAERYRWLFPDNGDSVKARVSRVYREWDGQSDWHATVDAAIAKGKP